MSVLISHRSAFSESQRLQACCAYCLFMIIPSRFQEIFLLLFVILLSLSGSDSLYHKDKHKRWKRRILQLCFLTIWLAQSGVLVSEKFCARALISTKIGSNNVFHNSDAHLRFNYRPLRFPFYFFDQL